ncbi:MAG: hypothetical protein J5861_03915 [Desulfovibrio sp.]|nr:hypothetical protein [Desulfovibrio sp.]
MGTSLDNQASTGHAMALSETEAKRYGFPWGEAVPQRPASQFPSYRQLRQILHVKGKVRNRVAAEDHRVKIADYVT